MTWVVETVAETKDFKASLDNTARHYHLEKKIILSVVEDMEQLELLYFAAKTAKDFIKER